VTYFSSEQALTTIDPNTLAVGTIPLNLGFFPSIAFSPNGPYGLVGHTDGSVTVIDTSTDTVLGNFLLKGGQSPSFALDLAFMPYPDNNFPWFRDLFDTQEYQISYTGETSPITWNAVPFTPGDTTYFFVQRRDGFNTGPWTPACGSTVFTTNSCTPEIPTLDPFNTTLVIQAYTDDPRNFSQIGLNITTDPNLVQFNTLTMTPQGFPIVGEEVTFSVTGTAPPGKQLIREFFQRRLGPGRVGTWEKVCEGENMSCTTDFPDAGRWVFVANGFYEGLSGPRSIIGTTVGVESP
jgi:hypothetical protein